MTCYQTVVESPLGPLTLASDGERLLGLWLKGQKYFGASLAAAPIRQDNLPIFSEVRGWLQSYFAGERPSAAAIALAPGGSAFRQAVWQRLMAIPYGQVATYGQLARELAEQLGLEAMSAQAVGGAVGHNPIAILIPCHRVVGAKGQLTGYAGGLEAKAWLLAHEKARQPALGTLNFTGKSRLFVDMPFQKVL